MYGNAFIELEIRLEPNRTEWNWTKLPNRTQNSWVFTQHIRRGTGGVENREVGTRNSTYIIPANSTCTRKKMNEILQYIPRTHCHGVMWWKNLINIIWSTKLIFNGALPACRRLPPPSPKRECLFDKFTFLCLCFFPVDSRRSLIHTQNTNEIIRCAVPLNE